MTEHPNTITAPAPHYGPDEDRFPGTLFTSSDKMLRAIRDRDFGGLTVWRLQRRRATTANARWTNLFSARSKQAFLDGLTHTGHNDTDIAVRVLNDLPDTVI